MRIAIVASDYAPSIGGVQTAVRHIARNAALKGHQVIILSSLPSSKVRQKESVDGIMVYRFPWGRRPAASLPFRMLWTLVGMSRVLNGFKPDLVYIHFLSIDALYVLLLHYVMRFRLVASARGNDIQGIPNRSRGQRWMLEHLFRRADAILFCSSYVQADAAPFVRHVSPRAYVGTVGDGFDKDEFEGIQPYWFDSPYILAMGRLVHKKGFDLLIQAFATVSAKFPTVHLLVAGDGEERASLTQLIHTLRVQDRVHLMGFTDRKTSLALFLGCEFFVLSSRIEPFGIVVLEAMAARKAVLATRSGGVVELIQPGVNGRLIEPTCEGLSEGLDDFLSHADETRRLGVQAAKTIDSRTWSAVTDQFLKIFEKVKDTA